jgi:hypothetical protein
VTAKMSSKGIRIMRRSYITTVSGGDQRRLKRVSWVREASNRQWKFRMDDTSCDACHFPMSAMVWRVASLSEVGGSTPQCENRKRCQAMHTRSVTFESSGGRQPPRPLGLNRPNSSLGANRRHRIDLDHKPVASR